MKLQHCHKVISGDKFLSIVLSNTAVKTNAFLFSQNGVKCNS